MALLTAAAAAADIPLRTAQRRLAPPPRGRLAGLAWAELIDRGRWELPGRLVLLIEELALCRRHEGPRWAGESEPERTRRHDQRVHHQDLRPHPARRDGQATQARWEADGFLPRLPEKLEQLHLLLLTVANPAGPVDSGAVLLCAPSSHDGSEGSVWRQVADVYVVHHLGEPPY